MASEQALSTEQVLLHHLEAFDKGVDAILADYAPDCVLLTAKGPLRGHEQIRTVFQWLLDNVFTAGSSFKMIRQLVEGEIAYIVWSAESEKYRIPLASDTYLIRDGKIAIQTFAAKVEPKSA